MNTPATLTHNMKRMLRNKQFPVYLLLLSAVVVFPGCEKKNSRYTNDREFVFALPGVFQYDNTFKDSVTYFKSDCINDATTFFIDKYKFQDTVKIDNEGERSPYNGPELISGDSASLRRLRDSLSSDGFQIIPDYNMSIPVNWSLNSKSGLYYPIYVVNETNSNKLFTARDRYVSAIQEAKDRKGKWRPIESKKFDFIGNGRWALIIHPYEYALFITAKYEGPYKTLIRIRMRIGDVTYLSKAFEGSIDEKQFYLKKDSYQYNEFKKDVSASITRRFLGAVPLENDQQ